MTETVTANVKDTATSAANDAVDSKLQDYATTATVNSLKEDVSSIRQKADSISTKVSSLEETTTTISNDLDSTKREFKTVKESVSAIDQKADSITQTVTQRITGGNNIIVGTDDWNNATLDAGGNDLRKKGTYTISGESVRVTNRAQNTRFHFGADKTLVIAKGMTYCASGTVQAQLWHGQPVFAVRDQEQQRHKKLLRQGIQKCEAGHRAGQRLEAALGGVHGDRGRICRWPVCEHCQ